MAAIAVGIIRAITLNTSGGVVSTQDIAIVPTTPREVIEFVHQQVVFTNVFISVEAYRVVQPGSSDIWNIGYRMLLNNVQISARCENRFATFDVVPDEITDFTGGSFQRGSSVIWNPGKNTSCVDIAPCCP